jgi:hypothetical protein
MTGGQAFRHGGMPLRNVIAKSNCSGGAFCPGQFD